MYHKAIMATPNIITIDYNSPEWAYILGYLWGDGHVTKRKGAIILGIRETDYLQISDIMMKVSNGRVRVYHRKRQKASWTPVVAAHICSTTLWHQMMALDYRAKTDQSLVLAKLSPSLHRLFWRGYLDADGMLRVKDHGAEVSFSSCHDETWDAVAAMLSALGVSKWRIERTIRSNGHKHSKLFIEREMDIVRVLMYLFDGQSQLGLSRKRDKAIEIIESIRAHAISYICIRMQRSGNRFRSLCGASGRRQYVSGATPEELHRKVWALHREHNTKQYQLLAMLGMTEDHVIGYTSSCLPSCSGMPTAALV